MNKNIFRVGLSTVLLFAGFFFSNLNLSDLPFFQSIFTISEAQAQSIPLFALQSTEDDTFCHQRYFGSISKDSCLQSCPGAPTDCALVQSYRGEFTEGLDHDLDCHVCDSSYTCYDLGYIYAGFDCNACEANPNKECVNSVGGFPGLGFPGVPLGKDSSRVQCWDCVNRADTCAKHWPGSTIKSSCDIICTGIPNHSCQKVGKNPDDNRDCYSCQPNPIPISCTDAGLLYQNQCGQCPQNFPNCIPAVGIGFLAPNGQPVVDDNGKSCFECVGNAKTCEEQGLKSQCTADEIASPAVAPNGAKCFTCAKKKNQKTCSEIHPTLQETPCQCAPGETPLDLTVGAGGGTERDCCKCIAQSCQTPDLDAKDCAKCEEQGGYCQPITRERGQPTCYRCVIRDKEKEPQTCEEAYLYNSCSPNPCSDGEACENVSIVLNGNEQSCSQCLPRPMDPTACENHTNANYPQHRFPNCSSCYRAKMACDEKQIADDLTCAKCLEPIDTRCEAPLIPGQCFNPECSDGSLCEEVGDNCHVCRPKQSCSDLNLPQSCDLDREVCRSILAENGDECCECEPKSCRDLGSNPESVCNNCSDQQHCIFVDAAPNGEFCYECQNKSDLDSCEDANFPTSCDETREVCDPIVVQNGDECCQCRPKGCLDLEMNSESICKSCSDDQRCFFMEAAPNGEFCFECINKTDLDSCEDAKLPRSCDTDREVCNPIIFENRDECCECLPKNCADMDMTTDSICTSCSDDERCVFKEKAPNDEACYECQNKSVSQNCLEANFLSYCDEDEECRTVIIENGDECCNCVREGAPTCEEVNSDWFTDTGCKGQCVGGPEACELMEHHEAGRCYRCRTKNICEVGYPSDDCNGCSYLEECLPVPGSDWCFDCVKKESCYTLESIEYSDCANCLASGGKCEQSAKKVSESHPCYVCLADPNNKCKDGYSPGACNEFACSEGLRCIDHNYEGQDCHICREVLDTMCMNPYHRGNCASCAPHEQCRINPKNNNCVWCQARTGTEQPKDLISLPANGQEISEPGEETTGTSEPGETVSVPGGGQPIDGIGSGGGITIEIEYVILIIETPRGRYILNNQPGVEGFKASQVMSLAKVESLADGTKKLTGMMPGTSGAMGLLSSLKSMKLDQLSKMLSEGMDKGRKYSDGCFDKNFSESEQPSAPPPSSPQDEKAFKKGEAAAPSTDTRGFGSDPIHSMTAGGPMIACGQVDGEKALAIFDAAGKPMDVILRDQLKNNPNAVSNALLKAEKANQLWQSVHQEGVEGFLKKKAATHLKSFAKRIMNRTKDAVLNSEDESSTVPNDPFFELSKKEAKKKKRKKKKLKTGLGSNLKIGIGDVMRDKSDRKNADGLAGYQWGIQNIGFTSIDDPKSAWNFVDSQSRNVLVAVIDSGIDLNHPDGPEHIWTNSREVPNNGVDDDSNGYVDDINGWNFLDNNNDLTDKEGHGSFVAGIIAAKWNNGIGIAGINPGAVIMPIKVADSEGETNSFDMSRALYYAVDNGARVINMSLGGRLLSKLEQQAMNYAYQRGVFVAVASGNVGEDIAGHGPASARGAFAVGAIDISGERSTISNFGPNNGLLGPGEQIYSLLASGTGKKLTKSLIKQGYYPKNGTSFSTPMVAATASLLLVQNPNLTPDDIEDILHRSADAMYEAGWDGLSGAGKLNAATALSFDVSNRLTVKIAETRFNFEDKDKLTSVDIFGTVRGNFESYTVELAKGKNSKKFEPVAGPFTNEASHDFIARLVKRATLKGSKEWTVRIKALDSNGQEHYAQILLKLP